MSSRAEILSNHYKDTFDFTLKLWDQRNRTFIILLLVVGVASLLNIKGSQAHPLLVDAIINYLDISDQNRVDDLRKSFPIGLIHSILLMVILYLMVQLYHRTITITRNYSYLGKMEDEIRKDLGVVGDKISFTREGKFYNDNSPSSTKYIRYTYLIMLGLLIITFLVVRFQSNFSSENVVTIIWDTALGLTILFFYGAYVYVSLKKPTKKEES